MYDLTRRLLFGNINAQKSESLSTMDSLVIVSEIKCA